MSDQSNARADYAPVPLTLLKTVKATKAKDARPKLPAGLGLYYRGTSPVIQWRKVIDGEQYFRSTEETDVRRAIRKANEFDRAARDVVNGWEKVTIPSLKTFFAGYSKTIPAKRCYTISQMEPFIEKYGTVRVDKFTAHQAKTWLAERCNPDLWLSSKGIGYEAGTVRAEGSLLRTMFADAKLAGLIKVNPFAGGRGGIKMPKASVRKRVLKRGYEQEKFLSVLNRTLQLAVLFILGTGVRLEEFSGIVPDDITRTANGRGRLTIRPAITKGKVKGRVIPFDAATMAVVDEQLAARGIHPHSTTDILFDYGYHAFRDIIVAKVKLAGIPRLTAHDLRRTYGTRMAGHVRNPKHLQLLMGHANIATTMEHYNVVEEDEIDAAVLGADLGLGLTTTGVTVPAGHCPGCGKAL